MDSRMDSQIARQVIGRKVLERHAGKTAGSTNDVLARVKANVRPAVWQRMLEALRNFDSQQHINPGPNGLPANPAADALVAEEEGRFDTGFNYRLGGQVIPWLLAIVEHAQSPHDSGLVHGVTETFHEICLNHGVNPFEFGAPEDSALVRHLRQRLMPRSLATLAANITDRAGVWEGWPHENFVVVAAATLRQRLRDLCFQHQNKQDARHLSLEKLRGARIYTSLDQGDAHNIAVQLSFRADLLRRRVKVQVRVIDSIPYSFQAANRPGQHEDYMQSIPRLTQDLVKEFLPPGTSIRVADDVEIIYSNLQIAGYCTTHAETAKMRPFYGKQQAAVPLVREHYLRELLVYLTKLRKLRKLLGESPLAAKELGDQRIETLQTELEWLAEYVAVDLRMLATGEPPYHHYTKHFPNYAGATRSFVPLASTGAGQHLTKAEIARIGPYFPRGMRLRLREVRVLPVHRQRAEGLRQLNPLAKALERAPETDVAELVAHHPWLSPADMDRCLLSAVLEGQGAVVRGLLAAGSGPDAKHRLSDGAWNDALIYALELDQRDILRAIWEAVTAGHIEADGHVRALVERQLDLAEGAAWRRQLPSTASLLQQLRSLQPTASKTQQKTTVQAYLGGPVAVHRLLQQVRRGSDDQRAMIRSLMDLGVAARDLPFLTLMTDRYQSYLEASTVVCAAKQGFTALFGEGFRCLMANQLLDGSLTPAHAMTPAIVRAAVANRQPDVLRTYLQALRSQLGPQRFLQVFQDRYWEWELTALGQDVAASGDAALLAEVVALLQENQRLGFFGDAMQTAAAQDFGAFLEGAADTFGPRLSEDMPSLLETCIRCRSWQAAAVLLARFDVARAIQYRRNHPVWEEALAAFSQEPELAQLATGLRAAMDEAHYVPKKSP